MGLVIAVIFAATMSASSGEINSLATVTVVDLYQRHFRPSAERPPLPDGLALGHPVLGRVRGGRSPDGARSSGSLIVAVNVVGSLFYGSLLGCFVLAFVFRQVRGTADVLRHAGGRSGHLLARLATTDISWLWYNVIGCVVVVATALAITSVAPAATSATPDTQPQNSRRDRSPPNR